MPSNDLQPPRPLLSGLCFPEGPRWHDGRLVFSDMHDQKVLAVDLDGRVETVADVSENPSGLGWLPDGRLLIVSMNDRRLLCQEGGAGGSLREVADLSALVPQPCNDMVVDTHGRAYVGNFGFDFQAQETPRPTNLVLVEPDGTVREVAKDLVFPNGSVITPDGRTLIVAETFAARLTAFRIEDDGSLSHRRVYASLPNIAPDGIALDAEGGVWVATPVGHEIIRVREGGEITHRIPVRNEAFACALGGPDRRTLFVCTAPSPNPEACIRDRDGAIEITEVTIPGAGLP